MSATSNLVCLLEKGSKGIVELRRTRDPKLMNIEALRVRRDSQEPFVVHFSLEIEKSVEGGFAGFCAGESAGCSFERNGRLRDTDRVGLTCRQQHNEAVVEVNDDFGFVRQMPLDAPLLNRFHFRRVTTFSGGRCPQSCSRA